MRFWRIPSLTVDKRRVERFLLTKLKHPFLRKLISEHIFGLEPQVKRIVKDFENLFGTNLGVWKAMEYRSGPHGELTSLSAFPEYKLPGAYLVLAPSASFFYKRWPVESFIKLTELLLAKTTYHLVVLAGPEDDFCQAFNQIKNDRIINLQGKTSLKESMSILSRAQMCIGNDSGMNHIAESYGVPCLTLFGPTDPKFGFSPHGNASGYIYKNLWCSPCSTTGKKKCFRKSHFCMEAITPEEVLERTLHLLEVP